MKKWRSSFCVIAICLLSTGCGVLFGKNVEPNSAGQPTLVDGDFPSTVPCTDRDIPPTDVNFLTSLISTTQIIHIYKDHDDDAELTEACGLSSFDNTLQEGEIGWNPEEGTDLSSCNSYDSSISSFLKTTGFDLQMCRAGYTTDVAVTPVEGFPRGGTYRLDACVNYETLFYHVRVRGTLSGDDVNKTYEEAGIEDSSALTLYDSDNVELTTMEEVLNEIVAAPTSAIFTVRSTVGDVEVTHLSLLIEIICITSSDSCPTPDYECT